MDNTFRQIGDVRTLPPEIFHVLNNQLQILLSSTETLCLTAENNNTKMHCSAIQATARRIVELIGLLAKISRGEDPRQIAHLELPAMQELLGKEEREAEI
jgi:hypothetical protein